MNAEDELRTAMFNTGLVYGGPIRADGKLHRFQAQGDHSANSWYVLHIGSPAAGAFGCWKRQVKVTWHGQKDRGSSTLDHVGVRHERVKTKQAQEQVMLQRRHSAASKAAAWFVANSKPADPMHPYLRRKGVKPFGNLRQWRALLVVPLCNASQELQTLQFVAPDNRFGGDDGPRDKNFLGGGKAAGAFFILSNETCGPLVICEGYATGASIHQATGHAVICAMNCGNLAVVARALRRTYPNREMIVAADNDQWSDSNPGLMMATKAAESAQARVALPRFKHHANRPTDFNDLYLREGLYEVKRQIDDVPLTAPGQGEMSGKDAPTRSFLSRVGQPRSRTQSCSLCG